MCCCRVPSVTKVGSLWAGDARFAVREDHDASLQLSSSDIRLVGAPREVHETNRVPNARRHMLEQLMAQAFGVAEDSPHVGRLHFETVVAKGPSFQGEVQG